MTATLYPKAKEALLKADLDMDSTIRIVLLDSADYTYDAAHDNLDDIPSGARIAISSALSGKTFTDGMFASDPASFASVTGDQFEAFAGFLDTGTESTSKLIWYSNSGNTGFPATPDGGNFTLDPDNTDGVWFDL